ncbi:aminopeptidase N [Microbacterium neungamense]|uniref:aminopeptidase N n=1 Tax=Microbacterium neungamense TaxID=2810535 RepID=UPI00217E798A|nr:aminopeptidase N [Microbacterium neungamense]UWF78518.1 aminopeptidase N [Microbacterium neungamense]
MPGENLTRIEAQERRAVIDTRSYEIALDLTKGAEVFGSRSVVRFSATPGSFTFIDLIAREVREISLNGEQLDPNEVFADSRIALSGLQEENVLVVDADCLYTNTGEGLHRFVDPVDGEVYLYTQFEVPDSRRVFAVFEQPDLKATFQFTVTAPAAWTVVSNSPTPEPIVHDPSTGSEPTATWGFEPTPRISSYITALIAGPYEATFSELTSASGRVIPLGVYGRKSLWQHVDAEDIFEKTRQGFAYFESKFGVPYPFAKYDQLFVPEFNAGAMENAGAVTFTETYVFRSKVTDAVKERRVVTILHELAHMWFGDLVTMKWWNDLWLNESFAEWASTIATAEATEWTEAWTTFNAMEKTWAYRQDQLPSTHPIVAEINDLEDVQVNFDGITYAKGGSVLKQLAAWVGIEAFFAGVSQYFQKHSWGNTELNDLLVELEATSGRDLGTWSKKWLETAGVNTLSPVIAEDAEGVITRFAVTQTAPADYPTIRPHRLGIGFYDLVDGTLARRHHIEVDIDGDRTEIPELNGRRRPDLVLLNDEDLAYAKIRLDERSLATAIAHLSDIADPLARSLVWGAAWDQTRDAESAASDYIDLVLGNIGRETESTTVRTTLAQLQTAVSLYVAPESRAAAREKVADRLWALAQEAAPGGDNQLQFVTAFANSLVTPEHAGIVGRLRSGEETLPGLEIDADLSWQLLVGLATVGATDTQAIDAALAADNTAKGAEFAWMAKAALPTPEAKRAVWDALVEHDDQPNTIVRSAAAGFVHPSGAAVLAEFVPAYFDMLLPVWESRTYQIAQYLIVGLYPKALADTALRDATRSWLSAHQDAAPALRRLVAENLADVERALAAQARDADRDDS